jgi:hypothetical protein
MSTVLLVGPIGVIVCITIFRPKLPFRVSSDPRGERIKPAVFYIIEDVSSVDFRHGREFRKKLHERWNASPPFRRLITHLTIFWVVSAAIYCGATIAVSLATPLKFAFGWTLGQLFLWAAISGLICRIWVKQGLRAEQEWLRINLNEHKLSALSPRESERTSNAWDYPSSLAFILGGICSLGEGLPWRGRRWALDVLELLVKWIRIGCGTQHLLVAHTC